MSIRWGHDGVAAYLTSLKVYEMNSTDGMTDEEFVTHRARGMMERSRFETPLVITPAQWLTLVTERDFCRVGLEKAAKEREEAIANEAMLRASREGLKSLYDEDRQHPGRAVLAGTAREARPG
jgi:hypothetical protein